MKNRGITLIALVITIIVLLILAGTTIATLTGENGIIIKAIEAKQKTEQAEIDEQLKLAVLSAQLKKQGGTITIQDILEELKKQRVEFEEEEDGTLIIGGDYIYEIEEKDGEITWENNGTMTTPKPKIIAIELLERTETIAKVRVTTIRNGGGELIYYIKEKNGDYQEVTRTKITTNDKTQEEYTFALDASKIYTDVKVEAIAENGQTASREIELVNVPTLREENVTFRYSVNGKTINEEEWTQGPVLVKVSIKNVDMAGYILQYATSDVSIENNWKEYTAGINVSQNGEIHVRLKDKTIGETGTEFTKKISMIDTKAPNTFTPTVDSADITSNRIIVKGKTTDVAEAGETAGSGIAKYYFGVEEGTGKTAAWEPTWVPTNGKTAEIGGTDTSYQLEGLKPNTTYSIRMKAVDKVGHETKSEIITAKTVVVPGGTSSIGIAYSNTNWTKDDVEVTLTNQTGSDAYKLQYSKDNGTTWEDYTDKLILDANGTIVARLTDDTRPNKTGNVGTVVNASVLKIDKTPPTISTTTPLTASSITDTAITLKIKTTDANSGLSKIIWYYKKSTDSDYTSIEENYQTMNGATAGATTEQEKIKQLTNLTKSTSYSIYAEIYDVAGNKTTSSTITPTTKSEKVVMKFSGSLGTGSTNGSQGSASAESSVALSDIDITFGFSVDAYAGGGSVNVYSVYDSNGSTESLGSLSSSGTKTVSISKGYRVRFVLSAGSSSSSSGQGAPAGYSNINVSIQKIVDKATGEEIEWEF